MNEQQFIQKVSYKIGTDKAQQLILKARVDVLEKLLMQKGIIDRQELLNETEISLDHAAFSALKDYEK